MHIYHAFNTLETHTFLFQIMVAFLSYISNACHSLSGVAQRLQHTCIPSPLWYNSRLLRRSTKSTLGLTADAQMHAGKVTLNFDLIRCLDEPTACKCAYTCVSQRPHPTKSWELNI